MNKSTEKILCKGFEMALLTAFLVCVSAQATTAQSKQPEGGQQPAKEMPATLKWVKFDKQPEGGQHTAKERPAALETAHGPKAAAVETVPVHTRYTFTGKGSWFTASNWENERMPPASLKPGEQVIIDGSGPCMYGQATPLVIGKGSSIEIKTGKTLYLSIGNSLVLQGGTLTNNGDLKVLSGTLTARNDAAGKVVNTGKVTSTRMATINGDLQQSPATTTEAIPLSKATSKQ